MPISSLIHTAVKFVRKNLYGSVFHRTKFASYIYSLVARQLIKLPLSDQGNPLVSFRGAIFEVEPGDITMTPTLVTQEYEKHELDTFLRLVRNSELLVDVGANIGLYSILAERQNEQPRTIMAFEPSEAASVFLKNNIFRNSCLRIVVRSEALSNQCKVVDLNRTKYLGTSSISDTPTSDQLSTKVKAITLDSLTELRTLDSISLKIDVEGHELEVLEGSVELIRTKKPLMLVEVGQIRKKDRSRWECLAEIIDSVYSTVIEYQGHQPPQRLEYPFAQEVNSLGRKKFHSNYLFSPRPVPL